MCRKTLLEVTQAIELERERQMLDKALADLEKATNELDARDKPCDWTHSGFMGDGWETDCGNFFVPEVGTPKENGVDFCPYCGHPVNEITPPEVAKRIARR